jgi:hypothetical protein
MRWIGVLGVLCFAVAPAFGDDVAYNFTLTGNSTVNVEIVGEGDAQMTMGGDIDVTIYASDGHIGNSDTFVLAGANVANTTAGMIEGVLGLLTANVAEGDLELLAFDPNYPPNGIHIGEGGEFSDSSGAHVSAFAKVVVTGLFRTTLSSTIASEVVHIAGTITTSGETSDVITMVIDFTDSYTVEITFPSTTLDVILQVHIEATAHHAPDPALGGLIALGLGGAGTWLRRRRRA